MIFGWALDGPSLEGSSQAAARPLSARERAALAGVLFPTERRSEMRKSTIDGGNEGKQRCRNVFSAIRFKLQDNKSPDIRGCERYFVCIGKLDSR